MERPAELSAHELATRLSYMLTSGPPDDRLRRAADAGELYDPGVLRAHAQRLVASNAGRA